MGFLFAVHLERAAVMGVRRVMGQHIVQSPFVFTQTTALRVVAGVLFPQVIERVKLFQVNSFLAFDAVRLLALEFLLSNIYFGANMPEKSAGGIVCHWRIFPQFKLLYILAESAEHRIGCKQQAVGVKVLGVLYLVVHRLVTAKHHRVFAVGAVSPGELLESPF